jgi:hypothetical protein
MSTATERLEERRAAVGAAERRLQEAEAAALQGRRRLERVKGPLVDYFTELGEGVREADPALERELREAVRVAEGSVSSRPVFVDGAVADFEVVDDAAEALAEGARRALEDRRNELRSFAAERLGDLLGERVDGSLEVAARLREALGALLAADRTWSTEVGAYRGLLALAGRDELAAELPRRTDAQRPALAEWDDQLRDDPGALVPVPRSLLPGPDDEA